MTFDPMAYITAAALLLGLGSGGDVVGGGLQVGARISWGAGAPVEVTVGVNPSVVIQSDLPAQWAGSAWGLAGVTLGGVTLIVPPSTIAEAYAERRFGDARYAPLLLADGQAAYDRLLRYELGHRPGWAHFGVEYIPRVLAEPCKYDPAYPWQGGRCPSRFTRPAEVAALPPLHYTASWTFQVGGE